MQLSAGIVIVRRRQKRWLYLILRAYKYWDFPKGEVEDDEEPLQTAKRETREETGLTDLIFRWGEHYCETEPYRNGRKKARYYLAATEETKVRFAVNPELGYPEHHEYRWLPAAEVKKLLPDRLQPIIRWAEKQIGDG